MGGGIACCCDVQWSCRCCTCWWLLRLCQPQSLLRMCIALAAVPTMPMLPSGASVVSFSLMLMENYKYTLLCNCMQIVLLHSMLRKKTGGMTRRMRGEKRPAKTPEASAKRTDGPIDPPSGVARRQPVRYSAMPPPVRRSPCDAEGKGIIAALRLHVAFITMCNYMRVTSGPRYSYVCYCPVGLNNL